MKPILVTCYVGPDLDGYAGTFAYAEFLNKQGREASAGIVSEAHIEAQYVLDRFKITPSLAITDSQNYSEIILVDASDLNGLGGKIEADKIIEIIDHRQVNEADKFPRAQKQIELVGAAATLIAEKFINNKIEISPESAILLYSAIISNTLNFRAGVTTERDRVAAAWLRENLEVSDDYWKELFMAKSDTSGDKLFQLMAGDFAVFEIGGRKLSIVQLELIGAEKIVEDRELDILEILRTLKADNGLDCIFLTIVELEKEKNYFVTEDLGLKITLEKVLNARFMGPVGVRAGMIMRKQIVPLIKTEWEK
ncbi:MAG TPA: DHHA2 domain-containing protein [Candidatus Saccharimonadales bacterium]|nr:DHHA2 domain-containing protein [Candidatus Saccharimonadales bacterium]